MFLIIDRSSSPLKGEDPPRGNGIPFETQQSLMAEIDPN